MSMTAEERLTKAGERCADYGHITNRVPCDGCSIEALEAHATDAVAETEDALEHSDDDFHAALTAAGVPLSKIAPDGPACDGSLSRLEVLVTQRDEAADDMHATCMETCAERVEEAKGDATRAALLEAAGVADHYSDAGRWGRQSDDTARENMAAGAAFVANQIRALADKPDANGGE